MMESGKEFERYDRNEARWQKEHTRSIRKVKFRHGLMGLVLIMMLFVTLGLIALLSQKIM